MASLGRLVKALIPEPLRLIVRRIRVARSWDPFQVVSYSQEGEDLILDRIFGNQPQGLYVDVGAHHPQRFSNTYLFYRRGWRGINIDAMPGSMAAFNRLRPRDVNLEIPIMLERGRLTYYQFNEPALNGFSKALSESRDGLGQYKILNTLDIEGVPLRDLLSKHLAPGSAIDFMSVDVEGLDLDVLKSNDWTRFRPKMLLVECLQTSFDGQVVGEVHSFVMEQKVPDFRQGLEYRLLR